MLILLTFLGLSVLVLVHEAGHFFAAKFFGVKVEEFGFGLPPRAWGKKFGETIYSINWLPFGGFVRMHGEDTAGEQATSWRNSSDAQERERSFAYQKPWKRSLIILAGIIMNFMLGWVLISAVFMTGTPEGIYITHVAKNSPAAEAGVVVGDSIKGFESAKIFTEFVADNAGKEISFTVERDSEEFMVSATPRVSPPPSEGALGVGLVEGGGRLGFFSALYEGLLRTGELVFLTAVAIISLIGGLLGGGADLTGVVGPIGIFDVASGAAQSGLANFLWLFAIISINLGVINAFPFPALDGGRFVFILFEKLRGIPVPVHIERIVNSIGFAVLLFLMISLTLRDIGNLL